MGTMRMALPHPTKATKILYMYPLTDPTNLQPIVQSVGSVGNAGDTKKGGDRQSIGHTVTDSDTPPHTLTESAPATIVAAIPLSGLSRRAISLRLSNGNNLPKPLS